MINGVKKSYLVFDIVLSIFAMLLLLDLFVIKNTNFLVCGISTTVVFLILRVIFGYEKKGKRFTSETIFYIFLYTTLFVIATYIAGIFTGFNHSIYHLSIKSIFNNILPYMLIILSSEFLRAQVARKCEGSLVSYSLVTIVLILIDCILFSTSFNLSTGEGQLQYVCNILIPSVAKNVLLMYISIIGGAKPTIIYRLLMEIKMFIIPIVPNFGLYIDSVVQTMIPGLVGIITYISLKQFKNEEVEGKTVKTSKLYLNAFSLIGLALLVLIVGLTSCRFKYGAIAIGSGSMTGVINKGDVIIYRQIGDYKPDVGEIIVFNKEKKIIVHRIIERVQINDDEYVYYTKGDANPTPDGYPLTKDDLIGIVTNNIKYIGIPSVYLNELINRKK